MFAIIDIETTGMSRHSDKITEIAVLIHDGEQVVDRFVTLLNPERGIPGYISLMTGITDEMVASAPKFYEIAKQLVEITDGKIFVAHNASFDYGFIQAEFEHLGYKYERKKLCTVQLSRKIFPNRPTYSLGKLCEQFKIPISDRHRAEGDCAATAKLFTLLIQNDTNGVFDSYLKIGKRKSALPPNLSAEVVERLPEKPGVYYFYDKNNELIYVGKSVNIRQRVLSHFSADRRSDKSAEIKEVIAGLDFVPTGSELVALLLESEEIKAHKPKFNVQLTKTNFPYALFSMTDGAGYKRLVVDKKLKRTDFLVEFTSKAQALGFVQRIMEAFDLCAKLCHIENTANACYRAQLRKCHGACTGKENPEIYNGRLNAAIERMRFSTKHLIIKETGRAADETAIVALKDGQWWGYLYFKNDEIIENYEELFNKIKFTRLNQDSQFIFQKYLREADPVKIKRLENVSVDNSDF